MNKIDYSSTKLVGPGSYNIKLPSDRKLVLAHNKEQPKNLFAKDIRKTTNKENDNPGPGAYSHYSIFGHS